MTHAFHLIKLMLHHITLKSTFTRKRRNFLFEIIVYIVVMKIKEVYLHPSFLRKMQCQQNNIHRMQWCIFILISIYSRSASLLAFISATRVKHKNMKQNER